jgi:hypothetical protein
VTEHPADALRYDDVRDGPIQLTPEELEQYTKRAEAMAKLLGDKKIIAKYKIEVIFGKARSSSKPTPGAICFWANGTKFHGGGDEKLYLCPGQDLKKNGCTALIHDAYNSSQGAVCPACGNIWNPEQLCGEILYNMSMRKWADVVYRYFRLCDYDCDIYLKFAPQDIRSVTRAQAEKATWNGSKVLNRVREKRARHIYPLRNIIKDTSAGADLLNRIYAFLVA